MDEVGAEKPPNYKRHLGKDARVSLFQYNLIPETDIAFHRL